MSTAPPARRGIESENTPQREPDNKSLAASVRRGALWSIANTVLLKVASLAITAVVAHILSPRDFGVFTVAMTVYAIVSSIGELGVSSCLIRADLDIDRLAPTMVTVSVVTSAVQAAAMVFFARPIASALGSPDAAQPIRVMALVVIIVGCFAVPSAQLVRNFRQEKLFVAEALSFIVSTAVLVALAKHGSGAIAFAWSRVAGQLVSGCVLALSAPKTYRPGLRRSALRLLWQVGVPLGAANIIGFILLNVDYGLIGHLLGAVALGVYVLAFNVASWPQSLLGAMINNVSMPAFSRVKNDPALLKSVIIDAVRAISLVVMPISALTVALADPLVLTLYGSKWSQSARILQLLALYGAFSILCVLFSNILAGLGRSRLLFAMQLYWLVALIPAMVIGVHFGGVVGAAVAHVIVIGPIILPFYVLTLVRMTGVRLRALATAVLPALLIAAVAGLAAREIARLLISTPLLALLAGGIVGGLIYAVATAPQFIAILNRGQGSRVRGQRVLDLYQSGARLLGLPSGRQPKHSTRPGRRPVQLDVPYASMSGAEPTAAELLAMARSTEVIQTGAAAFEVLMSLARPAPLSPAFAMTKQTPGDVTTPLERYGIGR